MKWYIVKRNWPSITAAIGTMFSQRSIRDYIGLGGDTWPLDEAQDRECERLHSQIMAARRYVELANGVAAAVCEDLALTREYNKL